MIFQQVAALAQMAVLPTPTFVRMVVVDNLVAGQLGVLQQVILVRLGRKQILVIPGEPRTNYFGSNAILHGWQEPDINIENVVSDHSFYVTVHRCE